MQAADGAQAGEPAVRPLRDHLAHERTVLANRRTWLAYARTGLALFVSGATFLEVFEAAWVQVVGVAFMVVSVPVVWGGWRHYRLNEDRFEGMLDAPIRPPPTPPAGSRSS